MKHFIPIGMALLLVGCSLKEAPPMHLYTLTTPTITPRKQTPYRNTTLKVAFPLSVAEPLSYKMVYAYNHYERGYYQNAQWSNRIGKLIQGNLIKTLEQRKQFEAVLPMQSSLQEDVRLESVIDDLCHYVTKKGESYVVVSISFSLIDVERGALLKSKHFYYKEPTPTVDASGYAVALNTIMAKLQQDLLKWL